MMMRYMSTTCAGIFRYSVKVTIFRHSDRVPAEVVPVPSWARVVGSIKQRDDCWRRLFYGETHDNAVGSGSDKPPSIDRHCRAYLHVTVSLSCYATALLTTSLYERAEGQIATELPGQGRRAHRLFAPDVRRAGRVHMA